MSHNLLLLLPPLLLPSLLCPTPAAVGEGFPAARPAHRLAAAGPRLGPASGCSGARCGPAPPLRDGTTQHSPGRDERSRRHGAAAAPGAGGGCGAERRAVRPAFLFLPVQGEEGLGLALGAFICGLSPRGAGSKLHSREVPSAPLVLRMRPCCCCCALRGSAPGGGRAVGAVPRGHPAPRVLPRSARGSGPDGFPATAPLGTPGAFSTACVLSLFGVMLPCFERLLLEIRSPERLRAALGGWLLQQRSRSVPGAACLALVAASCLEVNARCHERWVDVLGRARFPTVLSATAGTAVLMSRSSEEGWHRSAATSAVLVRRYVS